MPDRNVQPRHACLVHGRNVGRCRQAGLVRHGIGLDRAGMHLRYGIGGLVDHDVDLAGHKVLHRGAGAAVRHELEFCARNALEVDPADVGAASVAGGPLRRGGDVRLQPSDQFFQVLCWYGFARHDELRIGGDQRYRLKVVEHMILQLVDRPIDHGVPQWPIQIV